MERTRSYLSTRLGSKVDDAVLEYVAGVVSDPLFEFGPRCEDAVDTLGPILIGSGCLADDSAVEDLCKALESFLHGGGGENVASSPVGSAAEASAPASSAPSRASTAQGGVRLLERGPTLMGEVSQTPNPGAATRDLAGMVPGSALIQGRYQEGPEEEFTVMRPKDVLRLKKANERSEKVQRAAYDAHRAAALAAAQGRKVTIVRAEGGPALRDLHLERFTVSNGGVPLVDDGSVMLANGRRYGLVGRNGSGKTTFLRALAHGEIPGIPSNCQILHVEQEIAGDDDTPLDTILATDLERAQLLEKEQRILQRMEDLEEAVGEEAVAGEAVAGEAVGGEAAGEEAAGEEAAGENAAGENAAGENAAGEETDKAVAAGDEPASNKALSAAQVSSSTPPTDAELTALALELSTIHNRLADIGAYSAEARAATILGGLSFTQEMMRQPTKRLSGGWRMRVSLARALFVEPDLLLLDEPTNHLDLHAVLWLEDYLTRWKRTVVVVSHARQFLNAVCTDVVHLHARELTTYRGNYDAFARAFSDRVKTSKAAAEAQEQKKAHIQAFIDKFRYNAHRAALVQSRIKALERMGDVQVVEADPAYVFQFPNPTDLVSPPVLGFTDVDFGYRKDQPPIFRDLNFGVGLDSRFAIVGPNGAGKSTLLNLISGSLQATGGSVYRNSSLRLGFFSQHHAESMDLALTPLQHLMKTFPNNRESAYRSHLANFGVVASLAAQPMYTLSGGQKSRVSLATLTWTKPHMLLLDEPSNHLDLDAVEALIQGLNAYKGAVIVVSHDQYLIESTVDHLWVVSGDTVKPYGGTFEDYKKTLKA